MSNAIVIGKRIKKLREEKGSSQSEFCKMVGITQAALSNYENGLRVPRDEIKLKIARCLNTSIESLFFT